MLCNDYNKQIKLVSLNQNLSSSYFLDDAAAAKNIGKSVYV